MTFADLQLGDVVFVDANTFIYHFTPDRVLGQPICQQTGLLINDALIVALMQANRLTKLASHDADFDRVPGITRYAPV